MDGRARPEDGIIAVSDAKRKIHAKLLLQVAAVLMVAFGIIEIYLGAANLYRYTWWSSHYAGEFTDTGRWTEEAVRSYIMWGSFFIIVGVLALMGGLFIFLRCVQAVAQDNKGYLRRLLLPMVIIGFLGGAIICGILLLFVFLMYNDDRYDFFGLLLEDVTRRRRAPGPTPVAAGVGDSRSAYATGYQQQQGLYADDYAKATYGGGEGAFEGRRALTEVTYDEPVTIEEPAPSTAEAEAPLCTNCGRPTEWIQEYGRYYCYDCDRYV